MVCSCCDCTTLMWMYHGHLCPCVSLWGTIDLGQLSPAPSSGWAQPAALSSHRGTKCPRASCWSNTAFFTLSFFLNYAIIKKNSQTKKNALLNPKRFQRHFHSSFSYQPWHVLQNNSHFAPPHSLTVFIKVIQTINYYFSEKLWMD